MSRRADPAFDRIHAGRATWTAGACLRNEGRPNASRDHVPHTQPRAARVRRRRGDGSV